MPQPTAAKSQEDPGKNAHIDAFELKGEMAMLVVMRLFDPDPVRLAADLNQKVESAPEFFKSMPVVLDFEALDQISPQDHQFPDLIKALKDHGLLPVGVRNASEEQQQAALAAGLGVLSQRAPAPVRKQDTHGKPKSNAENPGAATSMTVTRPVRSGQQVYARERDLVVIAATSAGSELLSDGSIHVYGPLRGRALAGVNGDRSARIFCQRLEAELIAIAGRYRTYDELDPQFKGQPAQIWLEEDKLQFAPL